MGLVCWDSHWGLGLDGDWRAEQWERKLRSNHFFPEREKPEGTAPRTAVHHFSKGCKRHSDQGTTSHPPLLLLTGCVSHPHITLLCPGPDRELDTLWMPITEL